MSRLASHSFLGLGAIISLISLFPFGLIGEHKWVPNCFMVATWIDFSYGNSDIFPCITLLFFTQFAASLANALRCELSSIKPVALNNMRTVRVRALKWSFVLNHKPITFDSTLLTPHQVDEGPPSLEDSKRFSGLKGTLKMALPSTSYGNCFNCFFPIRLYHINLPRFTTHNWGVLLTLARKTIVQIIQFRGIRLNTGWLTIGWPIGRSIRLIVIWSIFLYSKFHWLIVYCFSESFGRWDIFRDFNIWFWRYSIILSFTLYPLVIGI